MPIFFQALKTLLIHSQIYVALCGMLLAAFFMPSQYLPQWQVWAFIFTNYFAGYVYTKFQHTSNQAYAIALSTGAFLFNTALLWSHPFCSLGRWFTLVVLGLLYNSFFLRKTVRHLPLIKIFYVGALWGLVNGWLLQPDFSATVFSITFLYVTALILPFDIRDMHCDLILTFPKIIGIPHTKQLATALLVAANLIACFSLSAPHATAFFSASVVAAVLIYFAQSTRPDSYFSFGIESCGALPFLFLVLLK
ncbi:hypothetical protein [Bergeyella sp. RCAD1439]|uniref:hypothetical protein n=1 Tax=Bergeyella anatis TaxID=3113737 RepID=UPI002E18C7C1|nr:hypothetical protein [Bergeyella sp. RCAD1439]